MNVTRAWGYILVCRYSGRTERELSQELGSGEIRRNPPNFTRVPSQRFSRRSRSEEVDKRKGEGEELLREKQLGQVMAA